MPDITQLIQSGSARVWLYIPFAILLGALHGLEPGHSKTMMAAFIIAVRGTVWQAVLLGLSAAISHSLIIWVLAALALNYGSQWNAEQTEPYFHLVSAALILSLALWMFFRTRREAREARSHDHRDGGGHEHEHEHEHKHDHDNGHHHGESGLPVHSPAAPLIKVHAGEMMTSGGLILPAGMVENIRPEPLPSGHGPHGGMLLDTGHGWLEISIHEDGEPPRFRIYPCRANGQSLPLPKGTQLGIETARLDGGTQKFAFVPKDGFWEAASELPEPHEFLAVVSLGHSDHAHTYRLRFSEKSHGHRHSAAVTVEPEADGVEYQDAHERAHAQDIAKRFANRTVTTPQIVLFGITGGLMPCPAAFTILLVCLQIKKATLGFALVAAFSLGLALTMVTVGVIAAWGTRHASRNIRGFSGWMRRAPYISCVLLLLLAGFMAWQGWQGLHGHGGHSH